MKQYAMLWGCTVQTRLPSIEAATRRMLDVFGVNVRDLVRRMEEAIIQVLAGYGVLGERRVGAPGIYVEGAKIASLGLRVRRGRSFHGLAFNIDMDLEPFQRINPCGFRGLHVTQLVSYRAVTLQEVEQRLVEQLASQLGYISVDCLPSSSVPGHE